MPRYFFHIREIESTVEDTEGIEFPDEAAVRKEAVRSARDLMVEHIRRGLDVSGWSYEVTDEHGRPIMTVPFSEAIRRVGG